MSEINYENILIQVKDALNRNSIKLWEEPYCSSGESIESEIVNLANILCQQLNIKYEYIYAAISELQNTALDNIKSIEEFNETGVATLKIRVPCKTNGTKLLCIKVKLTKNGKALRDLIGSRLEIDQNKIKVIANAKVVELDKSLADQGVKNNKQIMALVSDDVVDSSSEDPYAKIRKIRSEAEILLRSKNSGFLNIEDQSGKRVHLPENERRSIIMALLLYEKGRVQLKSLNYSDALVLFLEADDELKACQSSIVQSVDNVALLNLDIVWCYLNLKSIMQLPDAANRLKICEDNFKRSYGENMSRVQSVKGSSENEKIMIARLHLMQGILLFHQNSRYEAQAMLEKAEREIQALKVNEVSVDLLIEMGYKKSEAVNGLRSSFNSIDGAIANILDRRQKLSQARSQGKQEKKVENSLHNLGLSADPRSVISLTEMCFQKELCALALQKSNNDITQALNLLQNNQNDLKMELAKVIKPSEELIEKLVNLGFDRTLAENILKININDFQQTLNALLEMQSGSSFAQQVTDMVSSLGGSDAGASSSSSSTSIQANIKAEIKKKSEEDAAFDELRNDLDHLDDDDEYLTDTLEREESFLNQYKNALKN